MRANATLRFSHPLIMGVALFLATAGVQADTSKVNSGPGFDRVGKVVTGGMRGNRIDAGLRAHASRNVDNDGDTDQTDANLNRRKVELTKRMFWIMLSMR